MKMKTMLAVMVLSVAPVLITNAEKDYSEGKFKTLSEIQAEALEKQKTAELTPEQKRRERLRALTTASNQGRNRVKSVKESFKKRTRSYSNRKASSNRQLGIGKKRSFRGSRANANSSFYQKRDDRSASTRTERRSSKRYSNFTPQEGQEWGR